MKDVDDTTTAFAMCGLIRKVECNMDKLSLEQYMIEVEKFWIGLENLLAETNENELYHVYNTYRDDAHDKCDMLMYNGICKNIEDVNSFIAEADDGIYRNSQDGVVYYWSIDKYRDEYGKYERLFRVNKISENDYCGVEFSYDFFEHATCEEQAIYDIWKKLCGWINPEQIKITFSYKQGDILEIDNSPYSCVPAYFVYVGDGMVVRRDCCDSATYSNIFSEYCLSGYYGFLPCHISVVRHCSDDFLEKLSLMISEADDTELETIVNELSQRCDEDIYEFENRVKNYETKILSGKNFDVEWQGKSKITLEKYIEAFRRAECLFMELFVQPAEADELYMVKSFTRYDDNVRGYADVFCTYDNVKSFIRIKSKMMWPPTGSKEPLSNIMWWSVEKKKRFGNKYVTTMVCELNTMCDVISFELGAGFYERYSDDYRYMTLVSLMDLVSYSDKFGNISLPEIEMPYNIGDILYVDRRPKHEPRECVYLGKILTDDGKSKDLCFRHIDDEGERGYQITSLRYFGDVSYDELPGFADMSVIKKASDNFTNRLSQLIHEDRTIALKIMEKFKQACCDDSCALDTYIDAIMQER